MTLTALKDTLAACAADEAAQVVIGHAAPDTDAVISSIFEAWRRRAAGIAAVPVVQAPALPAEVAWLLGDVAPLVLTAVHPRGKTLLERDTPLVLTDHHSGDYALGRVVAIVDHHLPAEGVTFPGIDADIRSVGAATSLVALRCRAQGLIPDEAVARMLLGAILMDTEGLSPAKTRAEDQAAADWLMGLTATQPEVLFRQLREALLSEKDLTTLFRRDLRRFPGLSFAILKVWTTTPVDKSVLQKLLDAELAHRPVALAKISRYTPEGLLDEEYMVAGKQAATVLAAIAAATGGAVNGDGIHVPPGGGHLSRKRLTPLLLPLLEES